MTKPMTEPAGGLLDDDEGRAVIEAAIIAAGPAGQTREELEQVTAWAIEARLNEAALKLVLDGEMGTYVKDGELMWKML